MDLALWEYVDPRVPSVQVRGRSGEAVLPVCSIRQVAVREGIGDIGCPVALPGRGTLKTRLVVVGLAEGTCAQQSYGFGDCRLEEATVLRVEEAVCGKQLPEGEECR